MLHCYPFTTGGLQEGYGGQGALKRESLAIVWIAVLFYSVSEMFPMWFPAFSSPILSSAYFTTLFFLLKTDTLTLLDALCFGSAKCPLLVSSVILNSVKHGLSFAEKNYVVSKDASAFTEPLYVMCLMSEQCQVSTHVNHIGVLIHLNQM